MQFIAFDLETTGFLPGMDQIVEIGAVRFVNNNVEAIFSTLVDPQRDIPEAASQVNGITNDMLVGKPKIEELLPSFAEFCGDDLIIAHNASFDAQFLTADIEKYESPAPTNYVLDTLAMARKIIPGLPNYKLGTLIQHFDIPATKFHRAEEDASYCGKLFLELIKKLSGGLEMPPVENLVSLSGKKEIKFPQIIPQPKQLGFF